MKRRAYRRTAIKQFEPTVIREKTEGNRLVLAIDVAKEDMVAALADERAEVLVTLAWKHLDDTAELLAKLDELRQLGFAVDAVMESTGTYSDVLRHQLQAVGIPVYQVSGKCQGRLRRRSEPPRCKELGDYRQAACRWSFRPLARPHR
jgi:hypothetical protein